MQEKGTILLVDDEEVLRIVGKRTLERLGYRVLVAADGAEAACVLAEHAGPVSAVLLDLAMPGWTGPQTLRALRERQPELPAVLVSGGHPPAPGAGFAAADLARFLCKPYPVERLRAALEEAIGSAERPD